MSVLWLMTGLLLLRFCAPGFSIVGGNVSVPHSRPYMVYIRDPVSERVCGGFLVREDFVMTAAHCGRHLVVYLGVNDTKLLPDGVAVHPIQYLDFKTSAPGHDIMLLKLKTPATLNETVNTITLPKTENGEILKDCMVMGWGLEEYGHGSPSRVLKEANVTLIDSKKCVTNDTLCSEGTTGIAEGDSGGPLVCGDVAQGIVSFYTESNGGYCTRYTNISKYLPWIQYILKIVPSNTATTLTPTSLVVPSTTASTLTPTSPVVPSTTASTLTPTSLVIVIVLASFGVLLPALILWMIRRKRDDNRRGTDDSEELIYDETYTVVTYTEDYSKNKPEITRFAVMIK